MNVDFRPLISLLMRYSRRRQAARALRRELAHENMQHLIEQGKARNARAKLVAKKRRDPDSIPGDIPLDTDEVLWCAEMYLEPNENPRVSLDSLERHTAK